MQILVDQSGGPKKIPKVEVEAVEIQSHPVTMLTLAMLEVKLPPLQQMKRLCTAKQISEWCQYSEEPSDIAWIDLSG